MNQLFVHSSRFRILSPIFSGAVIYLLLLLLNNNVQVVSEQFLGQELYFCIGLAYIIQEFSRISIFYFSRWSLLLTNWVRIVVATLASLCITIILVTVLMSLYYYFFIGFSPNSQELLTFNAIFTVITLIYITLYISYDLLAQIHQVRFELEKQHKEHLKEDFLQFRRGLNPQLLLESLENLIALSKTDQEVAETFVDDLAQVYRYVLSRKEELIDVRMELEVLSHLVNLFNHLPGRTLELAVTVKNDFLVIPGILLKLVESVIRDAIAHPKIVLVIEVREENEYLVLSVNFVKKLGQIKVNQSLTEINHSIAIYSDRMILHEQTEHVEIFQIPKLMLE
ncbi:MAG: histidine kinase [Marinoscillum sp.]